MSRSNHKSLYITVLRPITSGLIAYSQQDEMQLILRVHTFAFQKVFIFYFLTAVPWGCASSNINLKVHLLQHWFGNQCHRVCFKVTLTFQCQMLQRYTECKTVNLWRKYWYTTSFTGCCHSFPEETSIYVILFEPIFKLFSPLTADKWDQQSVGRLQWTVET